MASPKVGDFYIVHHTYRCHSRSPRPEIMQVVSQYDKYGHDSCLVKLLHNPDYTSRATSSKGYAVVGFSQRWVLIDSIVSLVEALVIWPHNENG